MAKISNDDVRHLAHLSSLQLSDSEMTALTADIADILAYIEQLGELDTENIEPTYQVTSLKNVWREDIVEVEGVTKDELLGLAAEVQESQVKVPRVL